MFGISLVISLTNSQITLSDHSWTFSVVLDNYPSVSSHIASLTRSYKVSPFQNQENPSISSHRGHSGACSIQVPFHFKTHSWLSLASCFRFKSLIHAYLKAFMKLTMFPSNLECHSRHKEIMHEDSLSWHPGSDVNRWVTVFKWKFKTHI